MGDLRYGLRLLAKNPGFTAVAVLALAIGIGANAAIFSVIDAMLLRPLPYAEPDRLLMVYETSTRGLTRNVVSPGNFLDWKAESQSFETLTAFRAGRAVLLEGGEPEEVPVEAVDANYFPMLRASALRGRLLTANDDKPGAPAVVVISHRLWQRRFGGEPGVVGKSIEFDSVPVTVAGILPPGFHFLNRDTEVWKPLALNTARNWRKTAGRFLMAAGRLKPGINPAAAQTEMTTIARRLEEAYPEFDKGWSVELVSMRDQLAGKVRTSLLMLFGAVGFLLLIACGNVANLLLMRASSRRREIAVRVALGAGRWVIIRQLLTESVLLSVGGGMIGILLAQWGVSGLLALSPASLPASQDVPVDWRVLAFTLGLSLITGVLFGIAPAWAASQTVLSGMLRESTRSYTGGVATRQMFVVAQLALTTMLLAGAGLLIRSFFSLNAVDPGLDPTDVITMHVSLPQSKYKEQVLRTRFFTDAAERIRALPGVRAVSAVGTLPFTPLVAGTWVNFLGRPKAKPGEELLTMVRPVLPGYFQTIGIPLRRGRDFTAQDNTAEAPIRFVVNEAFVRKFVRNGDPLTESISVLMDDKNPFGQIVGVVGDVKEGTLDKGPEPTVYYNHAHLSYTGMTFIVRGARPLSLVPAIRQTIRSVDPNQPVTEVLTMEQVLAETLSRQRLNATMLAAFAALALVLASVGIYGAIAYSVTERTREIGVRIALGARGGQVMQLIAGQAFRMTAAGLGIGVLGASLLTRLLAGLLFGVTPQDPSTYVAVVVVLMAVSMAAVYVPARRASRIEPLEALRYE